MTLDRPRGGGDPDRRPFDSRAVLRYLTGDGALSRREALQHLARLAGTAALAPLAGGCGDDGGGPLTAADLRPEDLPIDTIVVLMMENRSFDHYFGSLSLQGLRPEIDGLSEAHVNRLPDGTPVAPFRLGEFCFADPPHGWSSSHRQFNDGANDGFVDEYLSRTGSLEEAPRVMGYYDRRQLPLYYALADEFALCERWFCSLLAPTWPNRYYLHSATSGGKDSNFPPLIPSPTTIYDRLEAAGIPWGGYYTDVPFLALYLDKLATYGPKLRGMRRFFDDAAAGTLPNYTILDPSYALADDHPPHHAQVGQAFVSAVYNALATSPQWERTLFVLTYDEHGGFHDHVAPPTTDDDRVADGFGQLGFRVPAMVVGPYVRRGYVSPTVLDHTAPMAFARWLWGLEPLTARDAAAEVFLDVLDPARVLGRDPRPAPLVPEVIVDRSQFRPLCVAEFVDDLFTAADMGIIPPELDRRDEALPTMMRVFQELERRGAGGLRL